MRFRIVGESIRNAELLSGSDLTFAVRTPWSWGSKVSTVTREGDYAEHICCIEWPVLKPAVIRVGEQVFKQKEYLRADKAKRNDFRDFTASDGKEYRWDLRTVPKLFSTEDDIMTIAQYRPASRSRQKHALLVVMEEGLPIIESIIISFVLLEKEIEEKRNGVLAVKAGSRV